MSISNPPKPINLTPYYILHVHTCSRPKASQQTGNDLEPLLFVVRWSKKKAQAQAHIFIFYLFFSCSFTCLQAASLYSLSLLFILFYFVSLLLFVSPGCFSLLFILYSLFFISAFYFFHFTSHADFFILYSLFLALLRRQIELAVTSYSLI